MNVIIFFFSNLDITKLELQITLNEFFYPIRNFDIPSEIKSKGAWTIHFMKNHHFKFKYNKLRVL